MALALHPAMKILVCNYEYPPVGGGGSVITAMLAEELARRHEVAVITSRCFDLAAEEVRNGVSIHRVSVPLRRHLEAASMISLIGFAVQGIRCGREVVKRFRPDIVNTHFALPSGPVGDLLAREAGCPNILSVHGGDLYDPSKWTSPHRHPLLRWWIASLMRRADRVVAQSGDTARRARAFYAPELATIRIPLGIERPPPSDARREDWGLSESDIVIVTVGRLVARKSVDRLVAMLPDLPERVRLIVIGDGPMQPELAECAGRLGVGRRVRFAGSVSDAEKYSLLGISDIFASTSQHEGFGLVFLEAMACGLPVVCHDRGGQTDFLRDGETGRLTGVGDHDGFVEALRKLAESPGERRRMGVRNREIVESYFIEHCARSYEELFEEVLARRRGAADRDRFTSID
ncbi:MAG: glycosyltransferase family 4 protein [Geminicoccaceae bacterium]|nr:glycosyltransferase family 4 protein [Geminicoccaceae bacterium]